MLKDINKIVHEPARLWLLMYLFRVEKADFTFLRKETGMTQGNLSSHLARLEDAAYILVEKSFNGKRPVTLVSITDTGRRAYIQYIRRMEALFTGLSRGIT